MTHTTHTSCPKPGCGYSSEGTAKQAAARMHMHMQRFDHSAYARSQAVADRIIAGWQAEYASQGE